MDLQVEDIIKMNVVLAGVQLLASPVEKAAFSVSVNAEVREALTEGFAVSFGPSGISTLQPSVAKPSILALQKERITLDLAPGLSSISREYPEKSDIERLAEVASLAMSHSDLRSQELQAYGFNLEVVCGLPYGRTVIEFLTSNVYDANITRNVRYQLAGGTSRIIFMSEDSRWELGIEPRFGDVSSNKIFMTLNLHKQTGLLPSSEDLRKSLYCVWEHAQVFASIFGGRE